MLSSSNAKSGKALYHARRRLASSVCPEQWIWKAWSYHWMVGALQGEEGAGLDGVGGWPSHL